MRFIVDRKDIFGIVGLPRSGTTIVSSIFNSATNAFALVEPKWIFKSQKANTLSSEKFGTIDLAGDVVAQADGLLQSFDVCAIKETFRIYEIYCVEDILNRLDSVIAVYRDPIYTFNSWRSNNWAPIYNSIDYFITNYERFDTAMTHLSKQRKVHYISHEGLCLGQKLFWNKNVSSLQIEGELQLVWDRDSVNFGDIRARDSRQVDSVINASHDKLNPHEVNLINSKLRPIYDRILSVLL